MSLNSIQASAVDHFKGPALVLAGAGAGKTRIVTHRIVKLLEKGVLPSQILALTFTNKAAQEMKDRIRTMIDRNVTISTFHSLGVQILRESAHLLGYNNDFTIYDEDDSIKLIRSCLQEMGLHGKDVSPKAYKALISSAKNSFLSPSEISLTDLNSETERNYPDLYKRYQELLNKYNAMDFDDLLFLTVKLLKEDENARGYYQAKWRYLLVDEYQDTNVAQYKLVRLLVEGHNNVFVVGDPDQSIYSWRGADIGNILNFEKDFAGANIINLEQNYRSTNTILTAANELIKNNTNRYEKELWSALGEGEKIILHITPDEYDEAEFICRKIDSYRRKGRSLKDIVIFYRTNFQSRIFEDALLREDLPYVIVGGISFYHRREIKDVLAFMRMVVSDDDFISFARTINIPKRGFGDTTLRNLQDRALVAGISIIEYCRKLLQGELKDVRLNVRQREGLRDYLALLDRWRQYEGELNKLVADVINNSGYLDVLRLDRETFEDRKANMEELINKASEWENKSEDVSLRLFLEELALKSNLDEVDSSKDRVNLMTIHNGKGLEYEIVFLVGMEEDLFPHVNAREDDNRLEEERRLCYVGITRAKELLYMTAAQHRNIWGSLRRMRLSRFVEELPVGTLQRAPRGGSRNRSVAKEKSDFVSSDKLALNDEVVHHMFGQGTVTKVYYSTSGLMYHVFFHRERREKRLAARYAKLKKID